MASIDQIEYCKMVRNRYPMKFFKAKVLDLGSLDINGNNRYLFEESDYTGVDVGEGLNVDIVCNAHLLTLPDESFDVIVSTEMLEHDQYWNLSLQNAFRMLKPGGMLLLTMGGRGRKEHGTRASIPEDSPFTSQMDGWGDYYLNLYPENLLFALDSTKFSTYSIEINNRHFDLYFHGIKNV